MFLCLATILKWILSACHLLILFDLLLYDKRITFILTSTANAVFDMQKEFLSSFRHILYQ